MSAPLSHLKFMAAMDPLIEACWGDSKSGIEIDIHAKVFIDAEGAESVQDDIVALLERWPAEAWGHPTKPLCNGLSYIDIGAVLGDQRIAFVLLAAGKFLGLWDVITPASFGVSGEQAAEMVGQGFVMMTPYEPKGS